MADDRERQSGAAGSATFQGSDSRRFNYFEPAGRRATLYEDVTVDVQPDVRRHLLQGWTLSFGDGTPTYHEGTTKLKSSDWHVYRAPDQEWERTHYQRQSRIEGTIKTVVDTARGSGAPSRFASEWVTVLQDHVGAMKHAEFGLGVALMKAQRDGVTQMINNAILTNSSYKLRLAQDITLYLGDIGLDVEIDGDAGKQHWMEDAKWQGVRKAIEAILAARDHLEVYFATNVIYEALVGELIRSGLVSRLGPANNDYVTPAVLAPAIEDYRRNLANTVELFLLLVNDAEYAAANKAQMGEWLKVYVPLCVEAARGLSDLWTDQAMFDEAFADSSRYMQGILAELDLPLPEGVEL